MPPWPKPKPSTRRPPPCPPPAPKSPWPRATRKPPSPPSSWRPPAPPSIRRRWSAYRADGDLAAAERLFKDWADYAPDSQAAHLALAELLVERDDKAGAAARYARLATLDPANLAYATTRAQLLLDLGLYAQAVDSLTPFADAEAPEPSAVLLLAKIQQAAGRSERAAERYRQFLAIAPDAPERADVEAALATLD